MQVGDIHSEKCIAAKLFRKMLKVTIQMKYLTLPSLVRTWDTFMAVKG